MVSPLPGQFASATDPVIRKPSRFQTLSPIGSTGTGRTSHRLNHSKHTYAQDTFHSENLLTEWNPFLSQSAQDSESVSLESIPKPSPLETLYHLRSNVPPSSTFHVIKIRNIHWDTTMEEIKQCFSPLEASGFLIISTNINECYRSPLAMLHHFLLKEFI